MANTDATMGLKPYNGSGDGPPRLKLYRGGTTTSVGRGDVVALAANGRVHRIVTTTGSAAIVGVAANYVAAPAAGVTATPDVWVYDDPHQRFVIQDDGDAATPAQAAVGATFAMILGAPNTTTGNSIQEIDASASGVATTDPLVVMGFVEGAGFEIGKNAKTIVMLNRHLWRHRSAGI